MGQSPSGSRSESVYRRLSSADTNAQSIKATPGRVKTLVLSNTNASGRYLKLYNKASAPTVGSDTPLMTIYLPATTTFSLPLGEGVPFSTGIAMALTTGVADADTGAVAANEQMVHVVYE